MEQIKGFSTVVAFQIMDIKRFNYLDWNSLFTFLKRNSDRLVTKRKINSIFRRLDFDADTKIAF